MNKDDYECIAKALYNIWRATRDPRCVPFGGDRGSVVWEDLHQSEQVAWIEVAHTAYDLFEKGVS